MNAGVSDQCGSNAASDSLVLKTVPPYSLAGDRVSAHRKSAFSSVIEAASIQSRISSADGLVPKISLSGFCFNERIL